MSSISNWFGLGDPTNKVKEQDSKDTTQEGVISIAPELTADIDDSELITLKDKWLQDWDKYSAKIKSRQKQTENYWLGS